MHFVEAGKEHFPEIAHLVSSPEELYLVCPGGHYPWTVEQLSVLHAQRHNFTRAMVGDAVAAFANLYQVKPGESAFIGNVIVAEEYRGRGLGKALTKHMVDLCRDRYQAVAHLSVFGFNARAMLMYTSLGFRPYDVEPRQNLKGETVALVHMRFVDGGFSSGH